MDVAIVSRRAVGVDRTFSMVPDALAHFQPDYVIVANRTDEHHAALTTLARCGFAGTVLIEKPLFAIPHSLPTHNFVAIHVGYNLRFHPVIQRVRDFLASRHV